MDRCLLVTDSCCELPRETVDALGITVLPFSFLMDGISHLDELGDTLSHADFYEAMRAGAQPTTSQVPIGSYVGAFRTAAEAGIPAVLLSFSSQLSGTFDAAQVARSTVLDEFPSADIRIIDTMCASAAQGLLVLGAGRLFAAGATADELERWVLENRQCVHGYFTLETLEHLRRGGRISDVAAAAGAMLDVRPVLKIDAIGRLRIDRASRGRKKSMRSLVDLFAEKAPEPVSKTVVVAHADCPADVAKLAEMISARREIIEIVTLNVGPVIGTHTGPGMLAVAFFGAPREA